jgi:hypothetical protein
VTVLRAKAADVEHGNSLVRILTNSNPFGSENGREKLKARPKVTGKEVATS